MSTGCGGLGDALSVPRRLMVCVCSFPDVFHAIICQSAALFPRLFLLGLDILLVFGAKMMWRGRGAGRDEIICVEACGFIGIHWEIQYIMCCDQHVVCFLRVFFVCQAMGMSFSMGLCVIDVLFVYGMIMFRKTNLFGGWFSLRMMRFLML